MASTILIWTVICEWGATTPLRFRAVIVGPIYIPKVSERPCKNLDDAGCSG